MVVYVYDKISKREGTVVNEIPGVGSYVIETVDNERFTQKIKLLTRIDKLTVPAKPVKKKKIS
jgi:hypothetical protein